MTWRAPYWTVFAITLAVYGAMMFWTLPGISAAAEGLVAFDMRPGGYSPDEARRFLAALTDEGRALYLGPQHLLDLFYPALLAIVLGGAVWGLVRSAALRWILLAVILGGMLADYTENALVKGLIESFAPVTDAAVQSASLATLVKSTLTGLAMIALCIAVVSAFIRRRKNR
jgi:hypothetical protein